jgi:DNA primase
MIDTKQINLLDLIGRDTQLKKTANTGGGEWHGVCPFCGGTDRFTVQPNGKGWSCRQCTPSWQDAIEYVKRRDGVGFKIAVETLGMTLDSQPRSKVQRKPVDPNAPHALGEYIALNDVDWQESSRVFCGQSFDRLWGSEGRKALDYLKARGISESVIESAGLGFNPEDANTIWGLTEVYLPRGIVIPWQVGGKFWRINIRRSSGEKKYQQVTGGANGLYNADAIVKDGIAVMVEGEFDCLVLQSHVKGITPVATGAMSWARVLRWVSLLSINQVVALAFDVDENGAGDKAVEWWAGHLGDKAIRLVPTAHDVTDMWKAGTDLQAWVEPYSLWYTRENTEVELSERARNRADMAAMGYRLTEVV